MTINYTKEQIKGILKRADKKIQSLSQDVIITTGIVFTSKTEFYYVFNIFKEQKLAEKIKADTIQSFDDTFKMLANKYKVNIIHDYSDLSYNQISFLKEYDKTNRIDNTELLTAELDNIYW